MSTSIIEHQQPDEVELLQKQSELESLGERVAELELEKSALQLDLRVFEHRYLQAVGSIYAELDAIEAQLLEWLSIDVPSDEEIKHRAAMARAAAQKSAQEAHDVKSRNISEPSDPSESLKKLYRRIVKRIHLDLGDSVEDRERRHRMMVEVNAAYEARDEERLTTLLDIWDAEQKATVETVSERIARLIRQIAEMRRRIDCVEQEIHRLKCGQLYLLYGRVEAAKSQGRDLIVELAEHARQQLAEREKQLESYTFARCRGK